MKISASIYSKNSSESLELIIRDLDAHNIDIFHVDCAEDEKAFEDIARIRAVSKTPVDLHIISSEPEKYFKRIEELKIEYVSFQYENLKQIPSLPKSGSTRYGLSITSNTSIEVFDAAQNDFDFLMMMSTVPGKSGGAFNRESFQKIIAFRHRFPNKRIHVDGGVNDQIAYILRLLGVHAVVSGSYLMNHESLTAGLLSFHRSPDKNHHKFEAAEFMVPLSFLPVLKKSELNFRTVIQSIEQHQQGFVLVTDEKGKLEGVITNADVRRGLLKNLNDLNAIQALEIVNLQPVTIHEKTTIADLVRLLNELNFIVLFLPVIDENNVLKGAVLLNNLTRF